MDDHPRLRLTRSDTRVKSVSGLTCMRSRRPFAKSISTRTAASEDGVLAACRTLTGRNAGNALLVRDSTSFRRTRFQNLSVPEHEALLCSVRLGAQAAVTKAPNFLEPRSP